MRKTITLIAFTLLGLGTSTAQHAVTLPATITPRTSQQPVDGKTFSYASALSQGQGLLQYLLKNEGVDSLYLRYTVRGLNARHLDDKRAKRAIAYAAGLKVALMNQKSVGPMLNRQATGKTDTTYFSAPDFNRALGEILLHKPTAFTVDSARSIVNKQLEYVRQLYARTNSMWLSTNAKNPDVHRLTGGVQYRILHEGNGAIPTADDKVKVHYEGRLIDGTIFDSSYRRGEPIEFPLNGVIRGWTIALTHMPVGSTWEVYIPARLAYGTTDRKTIPANSTLIFKIQLLGIVK